MGKESFDAMMERAAWHVITSIINGTTIRTALTGVYNIILAWQKEHGIIK